MLPYLSLPPDCSFSLLIRRESNELYSSCYSTTEPIILASKGEGEVFVDFSGEGNSSAGGFQLSLLSVPGPLVNVVKAVTSHNDIDNDETIQRLKQKIWEKKVS